MFHKICLLIIFMLCLPGIHYGASCHFNVPDVKTDVCKDLNLNNKLEDNPYVLLNANGGCGNGLTLPGLPDFGFDNPLGQYNNASFCDIILKALSGNEVVDKIKGFIGLK